MIDSTTSNDQHNPEIVRPITSTTSLPTPIIQFPEITPMVIEPPPPYRDRRKNGAARSSRRLGQTSETGPINTDELEDGAGDTENSPLLGHSNRRRTLSHSSTAHSTHSLAHTVFSLFQAEQSSSDFDNSENMGSYGRICHYFRPMKQRAYYSAMFHLLVINFPFALFAWIYLFVATFVGAALLLALPIGALLCWLAVFGGRVAARAEIALQTRFHGPLALDPPNPPHPYFWRTSRTVQGDIEEGVIPSSIHEQSFLKSSHTMFVDPVSYRNIFYFLVVKPAAALVIFIGVAVLSPPAFILVVPAPAVLRAIRKVGILQANIALESLL